MVCPKLNYQWDETNDDYDEVETPKFYKDYEETISICMKKEDCEEIKKETAESFREDPGPMTTLNVDCK